MDKIKTGIKGFDKLVEGGFNKGKIVLITGTPGTGKTIFGLEYLYKGAAEFNQKGLYVSLEESKANLINQASQFGWDLADLEKKGKIKIITLGINKITEKTVNEIVSTVNKNNIERVVIDSLSALAINTPTTYSKISEITEHSIKRFVYGFISQLRKMKNATTLMIAQTTDNKISTDGVSEFISDGILYIMYEAIAGQYTRSIMVRKMRETKNDTDIHPMEISKKGIVVHPGLGELR